MTSLPDVVNFLLLQAAPGGGLGSLTPFLFQLAAISAIVYFLMIRPQQKQRKAHEERLRNLKRGDTIVTSGGIVAEVVHLKEAAKDGSTGREMEDHVTIKSGESRLIVERGRIARVLGDGGTSSGRAGA
jgi:preprotein translocase subunit YajC